MLEVAVAPPTTYFLKELPEIWPVQDRTDPAIERKVRRHIKLFNRARMRKRPQRRKPTLRRMYARLSVIPVI